MKYVRRGALATNEEEFDEVRTLVYTAIQNVKRGRVDGLTLLLEDAYERLVRIRPPEIVDVTSKMRDMAKEMSRLADRVERLREPTPKRSTERKP